MNLEIDPKWTLKLINQDTYIGIFNNDGQILQGIIFFINGHIFRGEWNSKGQFIKGMKQRGEILISGEWNYDNNIFTGKIIDPDDIREGIFTMRYRKESNDYTGLLINGKMTRKSGHVFIGEWNYEKKIFTGQIIYPNGKVDNNCEYKFTFEDNLIKYLNVRKIE